MTNWMKLKMLDQYKNKQIINLSLISAEHVQKVTRNQLFALDNLKEKGFKGAELFAEL